MRKMLSCTLLLLGLLVHQKAYTQMPGGGYVEIKGKINHAELRSLGILTYGPFSVFENKYSITVAKNGTFQKTFFIPESCDIMLSVGEEDKLLLFAHIGDTISLEWDEKDFSGTIRNTSLNDLLNTLNCAYYQKFQTKRNVLANNLDTCTSLHSVIALVKSQHKIEFEWLKKAADEISDSVYNKIAWNIFFSNLILICRTELFRHIPTEEKWLNYKFPFLAIYDRAYYQLLPKEFLKLKENSSGIDSAGLFRIAENQAAQTRMQYFGNAIMPELIPQCYQYKQFYNAYFNDLIEEISYRRMGKDISGSIPDYVKLINAMFSDERMSDWLIADRIYTLIKYQHNWDNEKNFEEAVTRVKSPEYRKRLAIARKSKKTLLPGQQAPPLILRNLAGKTVMLEQQKGKYVYLAFWDSYCAPCIDNIKRFGQQVSKKYGDGKEIVVMYVSLDSDEHAWKKSAAKFNPWGNNYRLERGWFNPAITQFGVAAVPRYILINPDGTIRNADAPDLGYLANGTILE